LYHRWHKKVGRKTNCNKDIVIYVSLWNNHIIHIFCPKIIISLMGRWNSHMIEQKFWTFSKMFFFSLIINTKTHKVGHLIPCNYINIARNFHISIALVIRKILFAFAKTLIFEISAVNGIQSCMLPGKMIDHSRKFLSEPTPHRKLVTTTLARS